MKALVYTAPERLHFLEQEMPTVPKNHALVKIMAAGICGSDMHAFLGHDERRPAPLILGHEAAGTVEGGADHGKRVTINPLVGCGKCNACKQGRANLCADRQILSMMPRPGTFAQYAVAPIANLIEVPSDIAFEKAALTEPLACGWHAVRLGEKALDIPLAEAQCLVIGGGAIGLGAALVLKAKGARNILIAEPNQKRRHVLAKMDGFEVFDPTETKIDHVDLVVDGVGYAATRADACRSVRPGGVIAHIGLGQAEGGMDVRRMTLQEITFIGTYTYTPQDFGDTAQAIFGGQLGALDWLDERPLEDGAAAFSDIRSGAAASPKIVLKPWG